VHPFEFQSHFHASRGCRRVTGIQVKRREQSVCDEPCPLSTPLLGPTLPTRVTRLSRHGPTSVPLLSTNDQRYASNRYRPGGPTGAYPCGPALPAPCSCLTCGGAGAAGRSSRVTQHAASDANPPRSNHARSGLESAADRRPTGARASLTAIRSASDGARLPWGWGGRAHWMANILH
jgi:hypothetical protein